MALSYRELEALLDETGLKYRGFSDESGALLQFSACAVQVTIAEEGEGVLACAHSVFNLSGCPHKDAAIEWMANHNYRIKIGRWGYDRSDGEVAVDYFLPVEDGTLTSKQLGRVIRTIASEVRREVATLARRAYGGGSSGDEDEDEDDAAPGGIEELLRSLEDDLGSLSPRVVFDPETVPEGPVTEEEWMGLVVRALTAGANARAMGFGECDPGRIREWMERLRRLREVSLASSETPWVTVALKEGHGLTDEEELMLLWFGARHATGDTRILRSEAQKLCGSDLSGTPASLRALLDKGLVKSTDDDGIEPFCLSPTVVEQLGHLLVRGADDS